MHDTVSVALCRWEGISSQYKDSGAEDPSEVSFRQCSEEDVSAGVIWADGLHWALLYLNR